MTNNTVAKLEYKRPVGMIAVEI
ncbi:uncharacterized protein METZ01_LOCUS37349 [marine metagenome]|uniref:Uncharacterized protein n=1 Tax=marine metagenome TaxID=408172 RepID=A0A381QYI5_9ZZZZ